MLLASGLLFQTSASEEQSVAVVVDNLFAAMSKHDASAARALFIPEAMLFEVKADGSAVAIPYEKWVQALGTSKDAWLERTWNSKVLVHGSVAIFWANYDFHLNGKLSHCGIDSFNLLKTAAGWRIASISDTHEVAACASSPLGAPSQNAAHSN